MFRVLLYVSLLLAVMAETRTKLFENEEFSLFKGERSRITPIYKGQVESESESASTTSLRGNAKTQEVIPDVTYHGGPIMKNVNLYHIHYGGLSSEKVDLLDYFARRLGNSKWWAINTAYYDNTNTFVSKNVTLKKSIRMPLKNISVDDVFIDAITSKQFPVDEEALYVIFFRNAYVPGFTTQFCGYHSYYYYYDIKAAKYRVLKYTLIGDSTGRNVPNPEGCPVDPQSPNGNPAGDAMLSVYAHEVAEAATDPELNAWYDINGEENADKCAWTFGSRLSKHPSANMKMGDKYFLIQRNWRYAPPNSQCALQL